MSTKKNVVVVYASTSISFNPINFTNKNQVLASSLSFVTVSIDSSHVTRIIDEKISSECALCVLHLGP